MIVSRRHVVGFELEAGEVKPITSRPKGQKTPEQLVKLALLGWLREEASFFAWPVQNQGQWDPIKRIYRRPPKYFVHGIPDIEIALPGGITFRVECKSQHAKPSEDQANVLAKLESLGHPTMVAYGPPERALKDLQDYMTLKGWWSPI